MAHQPIADRLSLSDYRPKSGQIHVEVVVRLKVLAPLVSLSIILGGVVTLVAPPAPAQTKAVKSVWNSVDVNDGGFSILMPGIVDRRVNSPQVMGKATEQTLLMASQDRHDAFYMVAWSDLSVSPNLSSAGQTKVLNLAKDSFLKSFKGQLSENTDLRLNGNPGKQFTMASTVRGKQFIVRSRSYLVGSRLYHVLAAVPQRVDQSLIGSTQGFLKSFQLDPGFAAPQNLAQTPVRTQAQTNAEALLPAEATSAVRTKPLVQDPAARRLF